MLIVTSNVKSLPTIFVLTLVNSPKKTTKIKWTEISVIYWCSYKGIFRIFFPKFLQRRFCSMYQSVFANLILNAFWNWGVIILSRLSVWFYLLTNDRYLFIIRLSIVLLGHCFVKFSQISNFCHITNISQIILSLLYCVSFL